MDIDDELEDAWNELILDACASDGPIRDADVKEAVKRNKSRIENASWSNGYDEGFSAAKRLCEALERTK